ncbi:MAG: LamG-like jellyroll fold domain-containing protein [Nanoarchaeota archaeon]
MKKLFVYSSFIFFSALMSAFVGANLSDGLKLYYQFDSPEEEVSGIYNLIDYQGVLEYTNQSCLIGNCGQFANGRNAYVPGNQFTDFREQDMTVNFWVRVTNGGQNGPVIFSRAGNTGHEGHLEVYQSQWYFNGAWAGTAVQVPSFINNAWYMVSYTKNSAGFGKIYVDGNLVGLGNSNWLITANGDILLGVNPVTGGFWLNGQMDEMAWWNRTLSDSEIVQLYNNGNGIIISFDQYAPNVSIISPQNITYFEQINILSYIASDDIGLDSCWYSTDNGVTNTSVTCGTNVTGLQANEGSNTWKVWAKDTSGKISGDSVTFEYSVDERTDLYLFGNDIILSNDNPIQDELVYITAIFYNGGELNPPLITVGFYDGNPNNGTLIGYANISNSARVNDSYFAQTSWLARGGVHDIYVVLDPFNQIPEATKTNNVAYRTVNVLVLPELAIRSSDIGFTNPNPIEGQNINILAMVHNYHSAPAYNITISFYLDALSNQRLIYEKNISIGGMSTQLVIAPWTAVSKNHKIYVYADSLNIIPEPDENNNYAFKNINVSNGMSPVQNLLFAQ